MSSAGLRRGGASSEEYDRLLFEWHHDLFVEGSARLARLMTGRRPGRASSESALLYGRYVKRQYEELAEETGARVVVDSSKRPSDARFVASLPEVETYFVHMVRDPRAVAYSRQKRRKVMRPDGKADLDRLHLARVLTKWAFVDVGARALGRELGPEAYRRVRYEDFAHAPQRVVRGLLEWIGEQTVGLPFTDERTVELTENHAMGGNTNRAKRGRIEIRESTRWRREMRAPDHWLCTGLSLPFLLKYAVCRD